MGTFLVIVLVVAIVLIARRMLERSSTTLDQSEASPAQRRAAPAPISRQTRPSPETAGGGRARYSWQTPAESDAVAESEACWVPRGEPVEVAGRVIQGGMVYVGDRLVALRGGAADPALIVPGAPVAQRARGTVAMPYWPSYSEISRDARAAYLDWLAAGRRSPSVEVGLVFLFFYSIERRVLFDAKYSERARSEVPVLLEEVRQLLMVYGSSGSFRGYASSFLDIAEALSSVAGATGGDPPVQREGWDIPFRVKQAIGRFVAEGRPIPPEWAFSWLVTHPEVFLRTPAQRCPDEFRELFARRYHDAYGEGMVLKRNRSNLALTYRAASATFPGPVTASLDIPDVTRLTAPVGRLREIADKVQDELDRYSRWVGRNDDRTSPAALALLPPVLVRNRLSGEAAGLVSWLDQTVGQSATTVVRAGELLAHWPTKEAGKLAKQEAVSLVEMLATLGYGMEPDVRFGGPNPSRVEWVVLFRGDASVFRPSAAFAGASAFLHLGAAVAAADDEVSAAEERHLEAHLEEGLHVRPLERMRLRAHMRWLLAAPPSVPALKKKLADLSDLDRKRVCRFLLTLAGSSGHVGPAELKVLGKIYPLLGLNPDDLYADVHDMAAVSDRGPVTILPADEAAGRPIPRPPAPDIERGVDLDLDRIARIRGETAEVASILGSIFAGEDTQAEPQPTVASVVAMDVGDLPAAIPGLDAAHSALVRELATRLRWSRAEFDEMARRFGLMPGGSIEIINEASFAACDEPFIEGDDPIDVNPIVIEELSA